MKKTGELARAISKIVCECKDSTLEKLIQFIEQGQLNRNSSITDWKRAIAPANIPTPWLGDLISSWRDNDFFESDVILQFFLTAWETKKNVNLKSTAVELAWTGPHTSLLGMVRTNYAVLMDMIENASREILLVGYSFSATNERIMNIIKNLEKAKLRGCSVKIALHDNGQNHQDFLSSWNTGIQTPTMLKWAGNSIDGIASLHAKLLVVDNKELFITSANLTYHGMGSNMEMGVRITGEVARKVSQHFFYLESTGQLMRK